MSEYSESLPRGRGRPTRAPGTGSCGAGSTAVPRAPRAAHGRLAVNHDQADFSRTPDSTLEAPEPTRILTDGTR